MPEPLRVLVSGAGGQLGRELRLSAPDGIRCLAHGRSSLDLTDASTIAVALDADQPDVVVNAAAYTAVDRAESEPRRAHAVNDVGVGLLAAACAERGIRLLHVSTDFVFDGSSPRPYRPADTPAPLGVYGASKLAGEAHVRDASAGNLVLRTGWVYSRHGSNFVLTMLRLMAERDEVAVVADQIGTPTWARGLALALWSFVQRPSLAGIYHWSDAGVCSWYDLAVAVAEEASVLGLLPRMPRVQPITTADFPTAAQRPTASILDKRDTWRDLDLEGVHWRRQLRMMLQDLKEGADA
jgi:dTDP-4-dehydrorhamnose reductase